jgi:polysaccharide chain length determinant protein (PEP-CTERM system associated)
MGQGSTRNDKQKAPKELCMINPGRSYNVNDYKEIFLRRKIYFIIPVILIFTAAVVWAALAPRKYQASTLVLVTPQRIPAELIRSTVTAGIIERLNSISQEIMSRTRLEQIIDELKLYRSELNTMKLEEVVELMRKNIKVDIPKRTTETAGYFTVSFTGDDPRVVTLVANKLASLFIEENLRLREQQAVGTTEFLTSEMQSTKEKLESQGKSLADYKRRNMGSLPEQRDTNIKLLEQLQLLYQRNEESLRASEDRRLMIRKQMADIENPTSVTMGADGSVQASKAKGSVESQIEDLKKQLAELQSRYTDKHPDIVRTRKRIADLEKNKDTLGVKNDPRFRELDNALTLNTMEIKRLKEEGERLRAQLGQYRGRIEGATTREQEMASMLQEYNNTRLQYDTLIKKSEEAQQAENLEKRQKGEQFRIIDPARIPEKPFQPDIPKVLLIGLFAGLGCGLGGIVVREQLDRSFREPEDVEATLGLKVLANIPKIERKAA